MHHSHHAQPPPSLMPTLIDLRVIDLVSSPVWRGAATNRTGLSPEERNPSPLPAAWGLRPHHQTELPNVGSAPLRPAEATIAMNPAQPSRPIIAFYFSHSNNSFQSLSPKVSPSSTALLKDNFRKSFEVTLGLFTAPSCYQPLHTSTSKLPRPADQLPMRRRRNSRPSSA